MPTIEDIIKNAEKISLSDRDIHFITRGECKITRYSDLDNMSHLDELLGDNGVAIILYQTKENFGHFVALTLDTKTNTLTFFDPYALSVDEELQFSIYNLRHHKGKQVPHLKALIENSGYKLIENKVRLQEFLKDVNTCGRWCAVWVRLRHLGLKTFQHLFTANKNFNADFWVSAITLLDSSF